MSEIRLNDKEEDRRRKIAAGVQLRPFFEKLPKEAQDEVLGELYRAPMQPRNTRKTKQNTQETFCFWRTDFNEGPAPLRKCEKKNWRSQPCSRGKEKKGSPSMNTPLKDSYTSTGHKVFCHQEAMRNLRNGKGQPIVTHLMPTDRCQDRCSFCSVQTRKGDTLPLGDMCAYLDILTKYNLRAVIVSGGGNPLLYKCPEGGYDFNDLISSITARGLEVGVITNGMSLKSYGTRCSWKAVRPATLDKMTWLRISMSGLDHERQEVEVPDIDPTKTTLGFSYVAHDTYDEPADPHHGCVSTPSDLITLDRSRLRPTRWFKDRIEKLTEEVAHYVDIYHPKYVRLLPNCLEPSLIPERCAILQEMANAINPDVVFVQYKPPKAPNACFLGYVHPVLNSDGYVYPCDSCVLNEKAGHRFDNPWRVCHWSDVELLYTEPVKSLVDPKKLCPGCVFTQSNLILEGVHNGTIDPVPPAEMPEHVNFI